MLFSERKKLAEDVDSYIKENKIKPDIFGVICALDNFGLLEKTREDQDNVPPKTTYTIIENGKKLVGVIEDSGNGNWFKVRWQDGEVTVETNIDSAQ